MVVIRASNAGTTQLDNNTYADIFDEFGGMVQRLYLHTSCSQPLNLGDRFGALEVVGIDTTSKPPISLESEVKYLYKITNNTAGPAQNITVVDDKLGAVPGSPIPVLNPGASVTLNVLAMVAGAVTNNVAVTGELVGGGTCTDIDSATVIPTPPTGPTSCSAPIQAARLRYTGPSVSGPVEVRVVARNFQSQPVVYNYPGGLPTGTVISSLAENGFTIDATAHGQTSLGSKTTLSINGAAEAIQTDCKKPFVVGQPAPKDDKRGSPSTLWKVEAFNQK